MRYRLLTILLLICPAPAIAQTAADAVRKDISAMSEPELQSLLTYVAECSDRSGSASPSCKSARVRYETEFGNNRAIDRAIDDAEKTQALRQMISPGPAPGTVETDTLIKDAVRAALKAKRG